MSVRISYKPWTMLAWTKNVLIFCALGMLSNMDSAPKDHLFVWHDLFILVHLNMLLLANSSHRDGRLWKILEKNLSLLFMRPFSVPSVEQGGNRKPALQFISRYLQMHLSASKWVFVIKILFLPVPETTADAGPPLPPLTNAVFNDLLT